MVDLDLSVGAELKASIDGLAGSMSRLAKNLERAQDAMDHVPLDVPIMRSAKSNTAGLALVACGGPARGRQWQVRQLAVAGPKKGTIRVLTLGVTPTSPYNQGLKDGDQFKTTVTFKATFYSTHEMIVQGGETLWVVVTGATATTEVIINGAAEDYDIAAYKARVAL